MKYYKYIALVLVMSTVILLGLYSFYARGYRRFYAFEEQRLNELINGKQMHDILFLGSSRSYFHVNPKVIDSITGIKSFNGGIEGGNILETNMILQCYLASHNKQPKLVVIDLASPSLNINTAPGFRPIFNPNLYYPFLNNPYVFNAMKPYKKVYLLKYLPFLQFTEADDLIKQASVLGNFGRTKFSNAEETYSGYRERTNDTIELPFKRAYAVTNFKIEKQGVELLTQTIELCKSKGIDVIVTYAPVYKLKDEEMNPDFFPTISRICATYKIPLWNYRKDKIGSYHKLFADEMHLNNTGSYMYSVMLSKDINNHFQGLAKQGSYDSSLNALYKAYDNIEPQFLTKR